MGRKSIRLDYVVIGRILGPWGSGGDVKVKVETDFHDRFSPGNKVYLNRQLLEIERSRPQKKNLIVKFTTINCISDAETLGRCDITIPASEIRPLPSDEYYVFQLIGLDVITSNGQLIGHIVDVISNASNDVYIVETEKDELLVPAIEDVVKLVDLTQGHVVIELVEGLLP